MPSDIKLFHGDCMEAMKQMPDKAFDIIVVDPPYFEVMGAFDFKWDSFDDYLVDVKKWAEQFKRLLKENGTLFWFGDEKKIAYTQVIVDKYFGLVNNLVWWKKNLRGGLFGSSGSDLLRSFPICTERILMYSSDVYNLTQCVYSIRDYIRSEIIRAKGKIIFKEVNQALGTATNGGGVASACLSLDKREPAMFTREMYQKLKEWLGEGYLRREYEDLRREYEDLRRPFNNYMKLTEVLDFSSDMNNSLKHPTVKPVSLIAAILKTCGNKNAKVLDPFVGSGSIAIACYDMGFDLTGYEIDKDYYDAAVNRLENHKKQLTLF